MVYKYLIYSNIIIFLLELIDKSLIKLFGFIPALVFQEPWRLITGIFLHAGILHIGFNMFVLYSLGPLIERRIGSREFLILYFLSGIFGNVVFAAVAFADLIPITTIGIGASGAIAGLLGAAFLFYPNIQVLFLFIFPMPMYMFFFFYLIIEFVGLFGMNYTGIGSAAHLGGVIAGYFYSKTLIERYY